MIKRFISSVHFIGCLRAPAEVVAIHSGKRATKGETMLLVILAPKRPRLCFPLPEPNPVTRSDEFNMRGKIYTITTPNCFVIKSRIF